MQYHKNKNMLYRGEKWGHQAHFYLHLYLKLDMFLTGYHCVAMITYEK